MNIVPEWSDAFDRQVALNLRNLADIAGHYPFSPERLRLFVDGSRQLIQYDGEPAQYEDTTDSHTLKPQSDGEVVTLETTEIFRYHVGYVTSISAAFQTNQALQSGDIVTFGYGDADLENASGATLGPSADGWFFIWDSSLDTDEVTVAQYRNGTEQHAITATVSQALTDWTRREAQVTWYGVGATKYIETFTLESEPQFNNVIDYTSADNEKGPLLGNHPLQFSVKVGADSAGSLEYDIGSMGVITFGEIDAILRRKTHRFTASIDATDTYVALDAMRIDPDRRIVNVQMADVNILEYSAADDVQVLANSFDTDKLRDTSGNTLTDAIWDTPPEHSASGSVIETTADIDQFPDEDGTIGTSATNPGGYQEGYATLHTGGQGSSKLTQPAGQQAKRELSERDVVLFLGHSGSTGTVTVDVTTEQEW